MTDNQAPREHLRIDSIRIGRAPGIDGPFALTGLGPGLTVIHGPNGSGKSTTARSIHSLLWPDQADDGCLIDATLTYAGRTWTIRRDGRAVRCQRDGVDHPPLTFAHLTPDTRERYHLALHQLLSAEDSQFAALITREASGGFDIEAAARELGIASPPSAPQKQIKALRDTRTAYRQAVQKQQELAQQEAMLTTLETESQRAKQAGMAILSLTAVLDALHAQAELQEAIDTCHRFDTGMAHVRVDDAAVLAGWRRDEPLQRQKLADLDTTINRERTRIAETGLPPGVDWARQIRLLDEYCRELRENEDLVRSLELDLTSARQQLIAIHTQIAPQLPEPLRTDEAVALLRDYAEALALEEEAANINAAEEHLSAWIPKPDGRRDPERLQQGLRALSAWLQTAPPPEPSAAHSRARMFALIASLLVVGQGVALGSVWQPIGYGLAVVGLALALLAHFSASEPVPLDGRRRYAADYERLGLGLPASWTGDDVTECFTTLLHAYHQEREAYADAERWRTLEPKLAQRARAQQAAYARRDALEATIGRDVRLDRHALATLATSLEKWLEASAEVIRLERRLGLAAELGQGNLDAFNTECHALGGEAATNGHEARAALGGLVDRVAQAQQARTAIERAEGERDAHVLPALERIANGRTALRERYGGRTLAEIESLTGQLEPYQRALELVRNRRDIFRARCAHLAPEIDLAEWSVERAQEAIAGERTIEQRSTDVNQRIGAITNAIETAKSAGDVTAALAAVDNAREALRERRDEHVLKALSRLVLDSVRRETREANLPAVARRARALFAEITHGRYELNFNPGPPPSFTATDRTTGSVHTLEQLSSGTRVQLLIAVRTAFVEQNEQGVALPMILDETLANADDHRAEALIETTFKLCASGRQMLYFTAQRDEVEKWRQMAEQHQVALTVIDLAEVRRMESARRPPLVRLPSFRVPDLPAPNGHSRTEYRHVIGVPPIDIWRGDGGAIHLWHLMDDHHHLHRLVTEKHVDRWGQVQQLTIDGEAPALGLEGDQLAVMAARARACEAIAALLRIGRGQPVTGDDLRASGGMGGKFDTECLALLDACEGDGSRFLDCLENKRIVGFHTSKIGKFRDYFEAQGHIVTETALPIDEIRLRVARQLDDEVRTGIISLDVIDRLLAEGFASNPPGDATPEASQMILSGKE